MLPPIQVKDEHKIPRVLPCYIITNQLENSLHVRQTDEGSDPLPK